MLAKVKIQVMQHIVKNAVDKSLHVIFNSRKAGAGIDLDTPEAEVLK